MELEGDERTHFCMKDYFAMLLPAITMLSTVYLIYACMMTPEAQKSAKQLEMKKLSSGKNA